VSTTQLGRIIIFVYVQSQTDDDPCGAMWTAGSYGADGRWVGESDFATEAEAAARCRVLNAAGVEAAERMLIRNDHPIADVLMK
jgi:hypothetical protein